MTYFSCAQGPFSSAVLFSPNEMCFVEGWQGEADAFRLGALIQKPCWETGFGCAPPSTTLKQEYFCWRLTLFEKANLPKCEDNTRNRVQNC